MLFVAVAGCSSFGTADSSTSGGTGDAGACPAATCQSPGPACTTFDFAGGACPSTWSPEGDVGKVVIDCANGDLHVAAKDTLDVGASYSDGTPQEPYRMRISARIAITEWDGNDALTLRAGGQPVFSLRAAMPLKSPAFALCDAKGACGQNRFTAGIGEWHQFVFEVTTKQTTVTVDCAATPLALVAGGDLPVKSSFELTFGSLPASGNVDGRLDDVVVEFLPP